MSSWTLSTSVSWITFKLMPARQRRWSTNFRRKPSSDVATVNIQGLDIKRVRMYKYLSVPTNNKLVWNDNTVSLYKRSQSRLYVSRMLASFGACKLRLRTLYETVVVSVLANVVVCWEGVGEGSEWDKKRLNRLIQRARSVCGCPLDSIELIGERSALDKLLPIMDNTSHLCIRLWGP